MIADLLWHNFHFLRIQHESFFLAVLVLCIFSVRMLRFLLLISQSMKCFHNLAICSQKDSDSSNDCSLKHKRNIILEQICQSLDSGGLKKCIQSALVFPPGSGSGATVKV